HFRFQCFVNFFRAFRRTATFWVIIGPAIDANKEVPLTLRHKKSGTLKRKVTTNAENRNAQRPTSNVEFRRGLRKKLWQNVGSKIDQTVTDHVRDEIAPPD